MHPARLSQSLSAVHDIATYAASGQVELAAQARQTLDSLCAQWSDDLDKLAYPAPVRDALRAAGLRHYSGLISRFARSLRSAGDASNQARLGVTMVRFIAGIIACLLAQAIGLPTITTAVKRVDNAARAAYTATAEQLREGK